MSTLTSIYIFVSFFISLFLYLTSRLYSESSKLAEAMQRRINQKTIERNQFSAKIAILETKLSKLKEAQQQQPNIVNMEPQQSVEESQELTQKLKAAEEHTQFLEKYEEELKKQNLENQTIVEELDRENKRLNDELKKWQESEAQLQEKLAEQNTVKDQLNGEIENLNSQIATFQNQTSSLSIEHKQENEKEVMELTVQLAHYKEQELRLTTELKQQNDRLAAFEKNERALKTLLQLLKEENHATVSQLNVEIKNLNHRIAELVEENKAQAANSFRSEDETFMESIENFKDEIDLYSSIEGKLRDKLMKSYSMVLSLEKENLVLKKELRQNSGKSAQDNVIPFPQRNQQDPGIEHKIYSLKLAMEGGLGVKVSPYFDELNTLKAKIDRAREDLYKIQSVSSSNALKNIA